VAATGYEFGFDPHYAEDSGKIGANATYTPILNAYDAELIAPPETHQSGVVTPNFDDASNANQGVGSDISSLLNRMDDALDKRLAVGEWIRDHPSQAPHLTPEQVSQILTKVTFSLDQPVVAGEVAAGMEASHTLTCAHVAAAMRVCKYQATDVAKAMGSFVNDPQNKQQVLDEIEFSFECAGVDKVFAHQ